MFVSSHIVGRVGIFALFSLKILRYFVKLILKFNIENIFLANFRKKGK